jgi:16S rRNA (guanine527-N7)-methyltransferase
VKHGGSVPRETVERLEVFAALLLAWNRKINLISHADEPAIFERHISDSLQLAPLIPPGVEQALDLGSGGGFPAVILAIATNIAFTLVESDVRKCAFLREVGRVTNAPVTVVNARIEAAALPTFPLVTARALAPLPRLLALCAPFVTKGSILLFPKGAAVDAEIAEAENGWAMKIERHTSRTAAGGVILRISEVERA